MLGRSSLHSFLLTVLLAFCALVVPAQAQNSPVQTAGVETTLIAEVDSSVIITLDGETLDDTRLHRGDDGEIYVDALPIFETLGNQVDFDEEINALIVRRSQDGVVMELYTDTGIVKADGKALGSLPTFGLIGTGELLLTPNAIAVLSGAAGDFDSENNRLDFELDPRLRTTTGFDLIVNGAPIGQVTPEPKSVGSILLLPLRPVAEALGHVVTVVDGGAAVRVERAQDSAVFTLNLDTGLVSLFGRPIGFSQDISYIDPVNLLVPVSAFESLTGTSVTAGEGSSVLINLDDRLSSAVAPDGSLSDVAANTPFAVEYAAFELSPQTVNRVEIGAHGRGYSGQLRLELGELPGTGAELEPDWVSVDLQHFSGLRGSVGDASADKRQFDGIGTRRFRGVMLEHDTDEGRWAFAAGTPAESRRRISENQTRLDFSGLAVGGRYLSNDGWEAGLAARHDPATNDQMAILSAISGRLGRRPNAEVSWDASGAIGVFNGPSRASPVDVRFRGQARRDVTDNIHLDVAGEYVGAEFTRSLLRVEDMRRLQALEDGLDPDLDQEFVPDQRRFASDSASTSLTFTGQVPTEIGPLTALGGSLRVQHSRSGLIRGTDAAADVTAVSASAGAKIEPLDLRVSAGATVFTANSPNPDAATSGTSLFATAHREFEYVTARARLDVSGTDVQRQATTGVVTLTTDSVEVPLPRGANISVTPSVTGTYRQGDWALNGGVFAGVNSGRILGEKTRLNASLGIVQSASGRAGSRTSQFLDVSLSRNTKIGRNMEVGLGYRANLQGRHTLGLLLRGRYDFNAPQRLAKTNENTGFLQGLAFIDSNGDGVRQDDEIGAGGVIVRLQGTPHALRTGPSGAFSLKNLRRGIYSLGIDQRSLPLGYGLSRTASLSASVKSQHITTLDLPIQRFGQIRGTVFVDADASGAFDRGEDRPESVTVELVDASGEVVDVTASTAFGQFAFDALPLGDYTIRTPRKKDDDPTASPYAVTLGNEDDGMVRIKLPLRLAADIRSVEAATPASELPAALLQSTGLPPP